MISYPIKRKTASLLTCRFYIDYCGSEAMSFFVFSSSSETISVISSFCSDYLLNSPIILYHGYD
ncbi:MAG: hypothetical protein VZR27_13610 [Acutalibacteraceae bacterium]|nr:hypothetical protein [Acutalibacteraceae bacterium]